ncbi:MAG TPA: HAD-IA family hydrolase [Candidatus Saccharimonadales bacterium]|nr:HAD-IA family hydrolase [Candidatus Saccharimonadales bacterium]
MVKAIIFDCFGVLTTDGWLPFKRKYFGHDEALLAEATGYNRRMDAGLISYEDFVDAVSDLAGVDFSETKAAIEGNVTDNALFEYIAQVLKPQYKIGMLSNAGADWLNELFTKEQCALFDEVALSFQTGFVKPEARAYQTIAERLGVTAEQCVFVDDQERYCTAAREQGMQAIWYQDFDDFKQQISKILEKAGTA